MYLFGVPTKIPAEAPSIYALRFVVPGLLGRVFLCPIYGDMQYILLGWNIQKNTSWNKLCLTQPKPAPPVFRNGLSRKSEMFHGGRGAGRALFHGCHPFVSHKIRLFSPLSPMEYFWLLLSPLQKSGGAGLGCVRRIFFNWSFLIFWIFQPRNRNNKFFLVSSSIFGMQTYDPNSFLAWFNRKYSFLLVYLAAYSYCNPCDPCNPCCILLSTKACLNHSWPVSAISDSCLRKIRRSLKEGWGDVPAWSCSVWGCSHQRECHRPPLCMGSVMRLAWVTGSRV